MCTLLSVDFVELSAGALSPAIPCYAYTRLQEFAEARLYELWLKEKRLATRAEVGLVNTEEVGDPPYDGVLCSTIPASGRSD